MRQLLNYKLIIAYDGTNYKGWQDNHIAPSIEKTLQQAIERIQQHPVQMQAASRTDAGVHAVGQVVNFMTPFLRKEPAEFLYSLNALLPPDIRVLKLTEEDPSFHPTLHAKGKEYHYRVCYAPVPLPQWRFTTWHSPGSLHLAVIQQAAHTLQGTHDFAAFCNELSETHYQDTKRTLFHVNVEEIEQGLLLFKISGQNFLYKMVRNIVGTLIYVGREKISLETLQSLLKGGQRSQAGITAPAHGLTLHQVLYD